ncbi:hypothetical protein C8Q74DRAFT_1219003 [Fomes fomentarius]|nr:hypothetical protein C8Q74DRAFT_1219003 [Fomes fomentarius]
MTDYQRNIHDILACIGALSRTSVRYANRGQFCGYVWVAHNVVQDVTANFRGTDEDVHLLSRFQRHIAEEEEHFRERLETVMYDIDNDAVDPKGIGKELVGAQISLRAIADAFERQRENLSSSRIAIIEPKAGAIDDVVPTIPSDPTLEVLRYPPHRENFYPENEDALANLKEDKEECYFGENSAAPSYTVTMTPNTSYVSPIRLRLRLSEDGYTLQGWWDATPAFDRTSESGTASSVIMKHAGHHLDANKARMLWHFAISAVFYCILRRNFIWDFLKSRRDRRHRLASLFYRQSVQSLPSEDNKELLRPAAEERSSVSAGLPLWAIPPRRFFSSCKWRTWESIIDLWEKESEITQMLKKKGNGGDGAGSGMGYQGIQEDCNAVCDLIDPEGSWIWGKGIDGVNCDTDDHPVPTQRLTQNTVDGFYSVVRGRADQVAAHSSGDRDVLCCIGCQEKVTLPCWARAECKGQTTNRAAFLRAHTRRRIHCC